MPNFCIFSRKYDFTASSTWRSTETLTNWCSSLKSLCIKLWVEKCVEVTRINHCNSFFFCSHTLINEVTSNLKSSLSCSLTISCLEHIKLTIFDSKFHILHISVVILKS